MASPVQISVRQLARLIGTPTAPVVIDVRTDDDYALSEYLIPTAIRCAHLSITELLPALTCSQVVVYCQKGLKLSEGAAAILRAHHIQAEVLEGGYAAWLKADHALVPTPILPERNAQGQTVWVTRLRPKIDQIACPWLIRRFIDPNAQFLYVTASSVEAVADRFNGAAFDIEGVFWSHRDDRCTFDTMIQEFGLKGEALEHLALIVRGADTNRHDLAAESAGLLAASLGLSRMYGDDQQQLDAGMMLYDAFYRWCRDASGEQHDWPAAITNA